MTERIDPEDVERFDSWSSTYENSFMQRLLFDRVHREVLGAVPKGLQPAAILDIGCGTGRLLRKVAASWPGAHLYGVDPAEGMIAAARRLSPVADYMLGDAETLALPDESVDLVISTMSFHHWQDQRSGICQVARVLRLGGCFILADAIMPAWWSRISHHGRRTNITGLNAMLTGCGFKILDQKPYMMRSIFITLSGRKEA